MGERKKDRLKKTWNFSLNLQSNKKPMCLNISNKKLHLNVQKELKPKFCSGMFFEAKARFCYNVRAKRVINKSFKAIQFVILD